MKKSSNLGFIGINLLIAMVVSLLILVAVVLWLKKYTDHGHEMEVPQITGLYPMEAEVLLSGSDLHLEVIDSTFSKKVPLGTIVEQTPAAESHVKSGRTIYVVINASAKRQVVLPELRDISYRQAENILRQLGLDVAEIVYEPSEYRDLVLDLRVDSLSLETGERITEGTAITMVVGKGQGTEMILVPDVCGSTLLETRSLLLAQHLTLGRVEYDVPATEENKDDYVVYMQVPQSGSMLLEGSSVQVKMSLDKSKVVTADNKVDEEDFF